MHQTRERVTMLVQDMLNVRDLHRPDGRSLWKYGVTEDERTELEDALRAFCEIRSKGSLFYFPDESRSSYVQAAFGLYTALWFQHRYLSGNISYHLPLSELRTDLDASETRALGQCFSDAALDYWRVPAEHRQHTDLLTLSSQGGVQFARLASSGKDGWGTLAPLKSVIAQLASEDLKLSDSFDLLDVRKEGLPNYYQSPSTIECISTLIQWFWCATDRVEAVETAPTDDAYLQSLCDAKHEIENAEFIEVNNNLLSIYKLAFTEIATAQVRQKRLYHCDILLQQQSAHQRGQEWGITLNVRAPASLDPELSKTLALADHVQRAYLVLDMGSSHYQVAHYYRPYGGEFERDGYVQNTPSADLEELALGAQFSISGRPVFELPPVPLHIPLVFEESSRGYQYVGTYGTSLKSETCVLLIPSELGPMPQSSDYTSEDCGTLADSDIEYRVLRLSLPTQDAGVRENTPVTIELPSKEDDTDRSYIRLRAPGTYSTFLIPNEPPSVELDFGAPIVLKTTKFKLGNASFDEEVSREFGTTLVDYFPHNKRHSIASPPYGRHRVRPKAGSQNVEPLRVVVIPNDLSLTTEFRAGDVKIRVSPPVGAVSIQRYGDPNSSYRFENGEVWTIPSTEKLSYIPRLRITFEDWEGRPCAAYRPIAAAHSGFIARREDGLHALTNIGNRHQASGSLAELSSILFTADARAARFGKGLTLKAELKRTVHCESTQFMQRYWTFTAQNSRRGPLFQLGDIVEELRAMFRVEPHVDDTIHLSVVADTTTHTLKVRRDFGTLKRTTTLEDDLIQPAHPIEHPMVRRNLYAPARLVLLEDPTVVYDNLRFDDELGGWAVPEDLASGTYLFLTSRELYRPLLIPNGEYTGTSDWAQAASHITVSDREEAFETLFQRYAVGDTDDSVRTAIRALLQLTRSVEPTAFEGLSRLMQQPKALLRYLHVDHEPDKLAFERTLQSFESTGMRWWTIPGYHWFEASLNAPNPLNVFNLWPLVAQSSALLARSLIGAMFDNEVDYKDYVLGMLLPFTASSLSKDSANDAVQNHLFDPPLFEGSWSNSLVKARLVNEKRSYAPTRVNTTSNNSHRTAKTHAPASSIARPAARTFAAPAPNTDPLTSLRSPRPEQIRQALVDASIFVETLYRNDEIISAYAMSTLLPLRWIAPSQFDLLCAVRLA